MEHSGLGERAKSLVRRLYDEIGAVEEGPAWDEVAAVTARRHALAAPIGRRDRRRWRGEECQVSPMGFVHNQRDA